ncbi:MAG: archaeosortase/exosortase family protein [Bacteroidota bacterium]|nr:archaeosortase/exosortase family protein [Bacteroidota bacterium]MDP3146183.1 archaeosortase/exosortase family protein [Bacteroidota bacterium]MDP3556664.1 archaeosortase/exosortase family protein [Bacteroidota bacterium]
MRALFKQNAFVKFILTAGFLYLSLYLLYNFIIKEYTYYDQKFIGSIIHSVNFLLEFVGYKTFTVLQDRDYQVIGIDGSNGVWVGSNCNAITLFSLFSVFIIAYPGKIKDKFWFIPLGVFCIHFLNIIRVLALVLIANYYPEFLNFNHTYTFTFLIYSFIFLLWIIWVNKFSTKNSFAHED